MRNTLSLLSRSPAVATPPQPGQPIPSIRLISATPSANGLSSEASTSFNCSLEESWASVPVPLDPKLDLQPRKRLVPKKFKLSIILTMGHDKEKNRGKDLSDVVPRVGADSFSAKNGFGIYIDPMDDPDIGEIVMVKKKSRMALDGMAWGGFG